MLSGCGPAVPEQPPVPLSDVSAELYGKLVALIMFTQLAALGRDVTDQ